MVTARLRSTNGKIGGEIAQSINMAASLVEELASSGKLDDTQEEFHTAGTSIVSGTTVILKSLLAMKMTGEPVEHKDIARIADSLKEIYYTEFKIFDRVFDQLLLLGQHLNNVKKILSQQSMSSNKSKK